MTEDLDKLDRLCAEKIMGFSLKDSAWMSPKSGFYTEYCEGEDDEDKFDPPFKVYQPTRNIAQAWELLEKFERFTVMTWDFDRTEGSLTNFSAIVGIKNVGTPLQAFAATAPLAIVKACLKAKGVVDE